jgi:hypothetical protein
LTGVQAQLALLRAKQVGKGSTSQQVGGTSLPARTHWRSDPRTGKAVQVIDLTDL